MHCSPVTLRGLVDHVVDLRIGVRVCIVCTSVRQCQWCLYSDRFSVQTMSVFPLLCLSPCFFVAS